MKTDFTLQDQVLQELRWDGRLDAAEVGVTVQDGVVTLTGTVRSFVERNAAEKAALHVGGVLDVANDIHVSLGGSHTRTDAEIAQTVRAALERDITVAHERIQSSVSDGVVTLFGTLDDWHQVTAAENAVTNLAGVRDVLSELLVHAEPVDSAVVQSEIEEALERRAERAARQIAVAVHGGTATITGTVRSSAEKEAVLGAARGTRGVRTVEDQLRFDSRPSHEEVEEHLDRALSF